MGYGGPQLKDLAATIAASGADVVLNASPALLSRLIDVGIPVRQVRYELEEVGRPDLADVLEPWIERWTDEHATVGR
jgi:predicted GTPase